MCQRILASCPELRKFYADRLDVEDMIRTASEQTSTQQQQQQQQQAGEESGSKTILPQGWVCTKMEIMHVYLCGPDDGSQDWQRWVMEQISKLTRLEVLCIDPPTSGTNHLKCGVQLRLENGLEMLSGLKRLEEVSVADQSMDQEDIRQILRMVEVQPEESLRRYYYYRDYDEDFDEDSSEEDEGGYDDDVE
ncbi:hypothetical protein BG011_003518 [Mortierella polycephala]|uniref:Uncharacterized protein n=1 Tax=Mortierella polycephala TaxID=41804 RepID=A0A9P6U3J6_9FUNG|nr:hypothetical protein BG011_003518 [Mortierella polycephala]